MLAALACLGTSEELAALAAGPANALPRLPVVEILSASLGRPLEHDLFGRRVPVRDDRLALSKLLLYGGPLLAAFFLLGLSTLARHTGALLAALVLALGALLGQAERGVADVAVIVDAHLDLLLDAQDVALGRRPLVWKLQAILLTKLLGPLRKDLSPWDLGRLNRDRDIGGGRGSTTTEESDIKMDSQCVEMS